jgi:hypothetical protein
MILGMSSSFTFIHVALSLVGIASGFVVVAGMLESRRLDAWTLVFLGTTVATSVTGFGFARDRVLPSHVVGVISLVFLALATLALYVFALRGRWRGIYVVSAVVALYLNVFVLIVQAFEKVPALRALAPTQSDPPFAIVQGLALLVLAAIGVAAVRRFHPR